MQNWKRWPFAGSTSIVALISNACVVSEHGQPSHGTAVFSLSGGIVQTDATSPFVVRALWERAAV
jgi:hypothetical protein